MGLSSLDWFLQTGEVVFKARSRMRDQGTPQQMFDRRPVIGICNSWSELSHCNAHLRILAEHVKCGVLEAGGFPLQNAVMSRCGTLMRPTTMLYRNLVSIDVEESIRANPLDGVVPMVGCDKTTLAGMVGTQVRRCAWLYAAIRGSRARGGTRRRFAKTCRWIEARLTVWWRSDLMGLKSE